MKNIITVFKKEFYRVMSDRRLIFTTILLPGLAIYIMYSFMGNVINDEQDDIGDHEMIVYTENLPNEFNQLLNMADLNVVFTDYDSENHDELLDSILIGDVDLLLRFPTEFETDIDSGVLSDVQTYYNPGEKYSEAAYYTFAGYLDAYRQSIAFEKFGDEVQVFTTDINNDEHIIIDEDKAIGQGFATLLPMLIIMFLFSGAMSIGPDSIAGEKERGTIATLLVTPVKRSEIAIGKVMSLSIISLFSATSSFIGIMLSLPKLLQMEETGMSINIYGISDFLMLFSVLLATVLVIVGIISIISAYAKTIKEASMLILPFYFLSIVMGISTMFSGEASSNILIYLIPLYNSINIIISILTFEIVPTQYLLTIISSLVYVSVFILILNKLFQSEKIMFSK
jgi:sodium transport system permease protein